MRFPSPVALLEAAGTDLGATGWQEMTQERINGFAAVTGDHQWIHVDPTRAVAGPYGSTVAHGFLTLSLLAPAVLELLTVGGAAAIVNAGTDRVRFLTPVPVGGRVRVRATLTGADRGTAGVRTTLHAEVDLEGAHKPALVADVVMVFVSAEE